MTEGQRLGYINEAWHLSHLCGNWTCCNWKHFTVEPGVVNVGRNSCFMYAGGCNHEPRCMKHLKRLLLHVARKEEVHSLAEEPSEVLGTTCDANTFAPDKGSDDKSANHATVLSDNIEDVASEVSSESTRPDVKLGCRWENDFIELEFPDGKVI